MSSIYSSAHRHPSWNKVPWALSLFHMYDWIWLIDADTLIMNSSIPLTDYIDSDYHAVVRGARSVGGAVMKEARWFIPLPPKLNVCVLWLQITKGEPIVAMPC